MENIGRAPNAGQQPANIISPDSAGVGIRQSVAWIDIGNAPRLPNLQDLRQANQNHARNNHNLDIPRVNLQPRPRANADADLLAHLANND